MQPALSLDRLLPREPILFVAYTSGPRLPHAARFFWRRLRKELTEFHDVDWHAENSMEAVMDFGRGALLWLLGVPLPIILLLALFWHH